MDVWCVVLPRPLVLDTELTLSKVGMAYVRPFPWIFRRNISEEMLKVGRERGSFCVPRPR